MRWRLERQLAAYRDGELSPRARKRLERCLRSDPESVDRLRQMESLGAAVREAWTEGPVAPSAVFLVNALRPEMRRVDAELAARSPWQRLVQHVSEVLRPVPVTALAGTVAAGLLLVWLGLPTLDDGKPAPPDVVATLASPAAIYDLDSAEHPLLVYELEDGVTVIWLLEGEDHISGRLPTGGRWT